MLPGRNPADRISLRSAKARQKSGPGSLACSGEAFFCLDFFGTFCVKAKRTSLAAIERREHRMTSAHRHANVVSIETPCKLVPRALSGRHDNVL